MSACPATGAILKRLTTLAGAQNIGIGNAALLLIERGIADEDQPAAPVELVEQTAPLSIVSLRTVPVEWLTNEIEHRLEQASLGESVIAAAVAARQAAEGQLATVREQVKQLLGTIAA